MGCPLGTEMVPSWSSAPFGWEQSGTAPSGNFGMNEVTRFAPATATRPVDEIAMSKPGASKSRRIVRGVSPLAMRVSAGTTSLLLPHGSPKPPPPYGAFTCLSGDGLIAIERVVAY